jgi:ABC-type Fe3+-citrate transport system substrate-binding protein
VEQKQKEAAKKLSRHQQRLAAIKKQDFANIRKQLRLVMEKKRRDPVEVSSQYIHEIDTYEPLGKGFFGIVSKGYDSVLGVAFALKKVDMQVFENASPTRIEGILNSFQNEMNV